MGTIVLVVQTISSNLQLNCGEALEALSVVVLIQLSANEITPQLLRCAGSRAAAAVGITDKLTRLGK